MVTINAPWSVEINEILKKLEVDQSFGLSIEEAKLRLKQYGLNCLTEPTPGYSEKISVLRESNEIIIDVTELVPGDILLMSRTEKETIIITPNGNRPTPPLNIPADARLIQAENTEVFETHLTGSSTPSIKDASISTLPKEYSAFKEDIPNMIFFGTQLYKGIIKAVVVATGINTVISEIAQPLNLPKISKKKQKKKKKR